MRRSEIAKRSIFGPDAIVKEPQTSTYGSGRVTVGSRILWYLFNHRHVNQNGYAQDDLTTQQAIAARLGISRGHAAIESNRLVDQGLLDTKLRRVNKRRYMVAVQATKFKTYGVTSRGINAAMDLKEEADANPEMAEQLKFAPPGEYLTPGGQTKLIGPPMRQTIALERLVDLFQKVHFPKEYPYYIDIRNKPIEEEEVMNVER